MKPPETSQTIRVRKWIKKKRGILTQVAITCGVSPQFVQMVAYGLSTANPGHPVESELRRRGWPGIRRIKT